MSNDTPFNATMPPNTTLTSQTASRGDVPGAGWVCVISPRTNHSLRRNDHAHLLPDHNGEGYRIPSTTRATFSPAFNFLLGSFFDCGAIPPSAASMFLTIATRRGPISLRNLSSVKRNAGAPQLNA